MKFIQPRKHGVESWLALFHEDFLCRLVPAGLTVFAPNPSSAHQCLPARLLCFLPSPAAILLRRSGLGAPGQWAEQTHGEGCVVVGLSAVRQRLQGA